MTSTLTRREHKSAAAAAGVTDVDPDAGTLTAVVAVTGVRDDVGDILAPGCFRRTLRERGASGIKGVQGHDWTRPVAVCSEAVELMPGDSRLPATTPSGEPWPREAGALMVKARYILATPDGRAAWETARAFGPQQSFSIGYKVSERGARHRNGVRHIHDLDVFEFSGVLHGANRLAGLQSVKAATPAREFKSTATALRTSITSARCGGCGQPAAGSTDPLPPGRALLCPSCVDQVDELAEHLADERAREEAGADGPQHRGDGPDAGAGGRDAGAGLPDLDELAALDDPDTEELDADDLDAAFGDDEPDRDDPDDADRDELGPDELDPDELDPDRPTDALLRHLQCGLCGGPAGGQVGGLAPDQDVICPRCVTALGDLSDELADAAADDDERAPTTPEEYRTALDEQTEYELLADGTIAPGDPRTGQAWRTT